MQIMLPSNLTGLIQSADYRKIDGGKIWFGKPNQDPQSYPADVWLDKAMTIPAPPFLWLKMGYLSHNGNIVDVYASHAVSILITDAYNRQLMYLSMYLSDIVTGEMFEFQTGGGGDFHPQISPSNEVLLPDNGEPNPPPIEDVYVYDVQSFYTTFDVIDAKNAWYLSNWENYKATNGGSVMPLSFVKNVNANLIDEWSGNQERDEFGRAFTIKHNLFAKNIYEIISKVELAMEKEIKTSTEFAKFDEVTSEYIERFAVSIFTSFHISKNGDYLLDERRSKEIGVSENLRSWNYNVQNIHNGYSIFSDNIIKPDFFRPEKGRLILTDSSFLKKMERYDGGVAEISNPSLMLKYVVDLEKHPISPSENPDIGNLYINSTINTIVFYRARKINEPVTDFEAMLF